MGGFFITTKPARCKCSTRRFATIRHERIGVVDALAVLEPQREGDRAITRRSIP